MSVGSRTTVEAYEKAYEHRKISVAIIRKKTSALGPIINVAEGNFE